MKNLKTIVSVSKRLTAIALVTVMIFAACSSPFNEDKIAGKVNNNDNTDNTGNIDKAADPGQFVVVDVSGIPDSEWEYMLVRKDGVRVLMNVDDEDLTKAKPTRLYYQPLKNSDVGINMTCNENGLPEIMVVNNHIFYFTNFTGYTYDMAIVKPNDEIEYRYGVQTDMIDFDLVDGRAVSGSRSAWNPTTWDAYDWGSFALTFGSCAAGLFVPIPFAGLCAGGVISLAIGVGADIAIDILALQGYISEELGTVASSTVSVIVDALGCLKLDPFDCTQAFIGVTHTLFAAGFDFADIKEDKLREAIKEIEIHKKCLFFDSLTANGALSQSATSKLTLTLSSTDDLPEFYTWDIGLYDRGRTGAVKSALTNKGNGVYELGLSGITKSGSVEVRVNKNAGYSGMPYTRAVQVYAGSRPLQFISVTADGSPAAEGAGTSKLTLTFSEDIDAYDLYKGITLTGSTGAVKNGWMKAGTGLYEVYVEGITATGEVTVTVSLDDYFFLNGESSRSVTVYAGPVGPTDPEEPPPPLTTDITSSTGIVMAYIPAGTFTMGSPETETGRNTNIETQHQVTLTKGFYMGKYEVTQAEYEALTGSNPSNFKTAVAGESGTPGKLPVERVTWYDTVEFCNKLSALEGLQSVYTISGRTPATGYPITNATVTVDWSKNGYRLPTEAEWEYACRAGTTTAYNTGTSITTNTGWYGNNSPTTPQWAETKKTHQVGLKPANAWGLYDMHGNVDEWCWDWYGPYTSEAQTDPVGAITNIRRMARGGDYSSDQVNLRSASRNTLEPSIKNGYFGFRLVRTAQ